MADRTLTRGQLASIMEQVRQDVRRADAAAPRGVPDTDRFELAAVLLAALDRLDITVIDDEEA